MKHVRLMTCVCLGLLSIVCWSLLDITTRACYANYEFDQSEIDLVVVVCHDRLAEAITMLKSALALTVVPLKLHVFTEDHMKKPLALQVVILHCFKHISNAQFMKWNHNR